jgi:hypothetical protein
LQKSRISLRFLFIDNLLNQDRFFMASLRWHRASFLINQPTQSTFSTARRFNGYLIAIEGGFSD